MAITSLILGILAILTSFLPIINNGSFFLALLGIVFAIIGLVGIRKGKNSGLGIAIAGLILGIISVIVVLATQAIYSAAWEEAFGTSSSSAPAASSESADVEVQEAGSQSEEAEAPAEESEAPAEARYVVTVDRADVGVDYEGKPVIIVTFSWVNNSDETTSALVSLSEKAFQNGVELEHAFFVDGVDSSGWDSDVKPGSGTTFQRAYLLADDSDVTIEVEDPWDWSGNGGLLAEAAYSVK